MGTKSLRDQFAATKLDEIKSQAEQDDSFGWSGGTDRIKLEDGVNKIRFMPKHPDSKGSFYIMKGEHWCPYWNEEEGEEKRRPFLNARIHAGVERDLFEAYIEYAKDFLLGRGAPDNGKELWAEITGRDGIKLSSYWVAYVLQITKTARNFGLFDIKKSVRNAMNTEALIEDPEESTDIEPFTHPDTGKPVLITYNSKAKKANEYYKLKMASRADKLSDDELKKVLDATPLDKLYYYTKQDFEYALEALEYFDETKSIGIFDEDDWQEILVEIKQQFDHLPDADEDEDEVVAKPAKKSTKKASNPYEDMDEDELIEAAVDRELTTPKKAKKMDEDELIALLMEDDAENAAETDEDEEATADGYEGMSEKELKDLCLERELCTPKMAKRMDKEEFIELLEEDDADGATDEADDADDVPAAEGYEAMDDDELAQAVIDRELATPKKAKKLDRGELIELLEEDDEEGGEEDEEVEETPAVKPAKKVGISLDAVKNKLKKK